MTVHIDKCEEVSAAQTAWKLLWKKFCSHCGGWGVISYPSSRDDPGGSDPCSCLEGGFCPRCGSSKTKLFNIIDSDNGKRDYNDYTFCTVCGWNEYVVSQNNCVDDTTTSMVMPHNGYECECWYKEEYDQQRKGELLELEWEIRESTEMETVYDKQEDILAEVNADEIETDESRRLF
jgi:hypothetical protein